MNLPEASIRESIIQARKYYLYIGIVVEFSTFELYQSGIDDYQLIGYLGGWHSLPPLFVDK
jgi:hypothetical protein